MEVLMARLTVSITPVIEGLLNSYVDNFTSKLENLVEKSSMELVTKHCEALQQRITSLESENETLRSRLDETENLLRLENLVIHELAETSSSNTSSAMASGGGLAEKFKAFATKADGKEMTTADFTKWCKDASIFGKSCNSNHVDIAFAKVKAKASKNITYDQLDALINEMAKKYKDDHKLDEAGAKAQIIDKLSKAESKAHGATKISKTGGVDRMTDTAKYTGAHKERFDESGKGKGKDGRENVTENSGYVGNYKGAGTFDKK